MKRKRLFDFSTSYLIIFVICYAFLFWITLYNLICSAHKIGSAIALSLVFASFIIIIVRFGFMCAFIEGDRLRKGKLIIEKSRSMFLSKYDIRFKEPVIIIRDKNTDYVGLSRKEISKKSITVQATARNCALLSVYFGTEIKSERKPKPIRKRKKS